jgi:uncharacterized protein YegJ (DUF2314 family)
MMRGFAMLFWTVMALILVGVSLGVLMLWSNWRKSVRDEQFVSFVWLRKKHLRMSAREVAKLVGGVTGEEMTYLRVPGPGNVCEMPGAESNRSMFVVGYNPAPMGFITCGMPYFEDVKEAAEEAKELRIRKAILEHKAWMAIDALDNEGNQGALGAKETMRLLARIAADMADEDCLLLIVRPAALAYHYSAETLEALRSEDPLKALQAALAVPVIPVADDDEKMIAARDEARRRFGEFKASFAAGKAGVKHSIKAPVSAGGNREFIWINVSRIEEGRIYGTLGNDPVNLAGLKCDDPVDVAVEDLNDWVIYEEKTGEMTGGFTTKVLMGERR